MTICLLIINTHTQTQTKSKLQTLNKILCSYIFFYDKINIMRGKDEKITNFKERENNDITLLNQFK